MAHNFKAICCLLRETLAASIVGSIIVMEANKATDDLQFYVGGHTVTIEQWNLSNCGLFDVDRG